MKREQSIVYAIVIVVQQSPSHDRPFNVAILLRAEVYRLPHHVRRRSSALAAPLIAAAAASSSSRASPPSPPPPPTSSSPSSPSAAAVARARHRVKMLKFLKKSTEDPSAANRDKQTAANSEHVNSFCTSGLVALGGRRERDRFGHVVVIGLIVTSDYRDRVRLDLT